MRLLRKLLSSLVVSAVVLPAAMLVLGLDKAPAVTAPPNVSLADIRQAQDFLRRFDPRSMQADRVTEISASAGELNTALHAGLSAVPEVKGRVAVDRAGLSLFTTAELPLPDNPLGRYVNVRATLAPSRGGLEVARFAVGTLELPPEVVKPVLGALLDYFLGDGKGGPALASVKQVSVAGDRVTVAFRPPPDLAADVRAAARKAIHAADPEKVRAYLQRIAEIAASHAKKDTVSFGAFVGPLFQLARNRSTGVDPLAENRALIFALAIFFGDQRFERILGDVRPAALQPPPLDPWRVRLNGRHDWVQHFTISAALLLGGGSGIANAIGEAKEIKDADGPSGFSFTDIAADRAGVRFAQRATGSVEQARLVQRVLAKETVKESEFFPNVADLPEGLSQAQFAGRFSGTGSPAYATMIDQIDLRIAAIPLYR
jgi:hypothetical protein